MLEEIQIMKGWTLPFFPMRPANGPRLTKPLVVEILKKMEDGRYIYQPKLNGDRALLGIVDKRVVVCNRHYGWYQFQVANAGAFQAKCGSGTLFDGEVYKSNFYPFECLALEGRSFKANTVDEREIIAMQMCRLAGVQWMYKKPTRAWMLKGSSLLPQFEGVVRKRSDFPYTFLPNSSGTSVGWLKHKF
jgi:hypothetical protein